MTCSGSHWWEDIELAPSTSLWTRARERLRAATQSVNSAVNLSSELETALVLFRRGWGVGTDIPYAATLDFMCLWFESCTYICRFIIYIYMYIHTHTSLHTYIHIYIYVHTHILP